MNLSYCKFRNTLTAFNEILNDINEKQENEAEEKARIKLLSLIDEISFYKTNK